MQVGDAVVTSDRVRRAFLLGTLKSPSEWTQDFNGRKPHVRRVRSAHEVAWDVLREATKRHLSRPPRVYRIGEDAATERRAKASRLRESP
jgi:predicted Mrr-cat superfamily restriction endonuclease